ncbi:MAG TPA: cbb3-type cytochrome c oxidase N-terminal domain-containing protein [Bacteroidales bacterium]|nr:cbb3-type cytochrome c oxidase N-terminal domain-containing protein [Bacteroidales bacterium]
MEPKKGVQYETDELTGDKLFADHDYDGIKELDNKLPKWWLWLFYITIVFSAIYVLRYHVTGWGPLQQEEYEMEMAEARVTFSSNESSGSIDASTVTLLTDDASLLAGKEIYDKSCSVCHLPQGQGLVGPNLTDDYWIHGCSIGDIFNIIVVGVPEKGMISWESQLTSTQIQQVSSYILTLKGTNPPNPKEPQGEICE